MEEEKREKKGLSGKLKWIAFKEKEFLKWILYLNIKSIILKGDCAYTLGGVRGQGSIRHNSKRSTPRMVNAKHKKQKSSASNSFENQPTEPFFDLPENNRSFD